MKIENLYDCYLLSKIGDIIAVNTQRSGVVICIQPYDEIMLEVFSKNHKIINILINEENNNKYKPVILLSEIKKDEDRFWFKNTVVDKDTFLFEKLKDFALSKTLIRNQRNINDFIKASIDIICNKAGVSKIDKNNAVKTVVKYIILNEPDNFDLVSYIISEVNILISGNIKNIKGDIFK